MRAVHEHNHWFLVSISKVRTEEATDLAKTAIVEELTTDIPTLVKILRI